jgi:predicted DNA-binding transcriptional regulator YafY
MGFDNNPYLKGIEYISSLYNAILYKRVLLIRYQSFLEDRPSDFEIHPYYLKEYNHRWFLFGYNPQMKKYDWNLALDRIISIKELSNKFNANNKIKWEQYFEDIIGVTKKESAKCEQIVLHFIGTTGKYIETKPIHGSQKSKWIDKNTIEVRLQLIINYELERLILSYADAVKVIKPISLKKQIKTKLTTGISNFN